VERERERQDGLTVEWNGKMKWMTMVMVMVGDGARPFLFFINIIWYSSFGVHVINNNNNKSAPKYFTHRKEA